MMTNYKYGIVRMLPVRAHLAMDAAESSMLLSARKMVGNEGGAGRVLAMFGAIGATTGSMTKTESAFERKELPA